MVITHGGTVFAAARERGWGWREVLDFSASINPLGPAPGVRRAITEAVDEIVHYPDPYASRLLHALAEEWGVEPDCILVGNGATDLIHFVARTLEPGPVTLVVPTFSEFHRAWPGAGLVRIEECWPDDGLLVLTNPNNPTGQAAAVQERRGLTLVDESFIEFTSSRSALLAGRDPLPHGRGSERAAEGTAAEGMRAEGRASGGARAGEGQGVASGVACAGGYRAATVRERCLVLRSLTKFQAMPGLRVGAVVGPPDLMRWLRERREPWQVNVLAQAAALEALRDKEHARVTREYVTEEADRVFRAVSELHDVRPWRPTANYIFAELHYPAARLAEHLLEHRMLIRVCTAMPGIDGEAVRFAIRTREENNRLLQVWSEFQC